MRCMSWSLPSLWRGRRVGRSGTRKTAVTVVVPRPLEPPFPGGPGSSCRTRRLEPQGPCLPAGPPELLLGLVREGAAVHAAIITHSGWKMQPPSANLHPVVMGWYTSPVPRHRRTRRASFRPPARLVRACAFAAVAAFALPALSPPQVDGPEPAAARVIQPAPTALPAQPTGQVAGAAQESEAAASPDTAAARPSSIRLTRRTCTITAGRSPRPGSRCHSDPPAGPGSWTASCSTTASTWRRSAATPVGAAHDGVGPRRRPPLRRADRLARRPDAVSPPARQPKLCGRRCRTSSSSTTATATAAIYAHFRDVTVRVGQRVKAGQLIGHEGATGHASGCHVHYGLFSPLETRTFAIEPTSSAA